MDKLLFFVTLQAYSPDAFRLPLYSPSPEFSFPSSPFPAQVLPLRALRCSGTAVSHLLKSAGEGDETEIPPFAFVPLCFPPIFRVVFPPFILGFGPAAQGLHLLPRHDPPSPRPRSSAAGAGCAPGAYKSTACSQNLATMNPGSLLNQEKNCVGFHSATLRVLHSSTSRTPE